MFLRFGLRDLVVLRDVSPWQQAVRVQAIPRKRGNGDRAQGQEAAAGWRDHQQRGLLIRCDGQPVRARPEHACPPAPSAPCRATWMRAWCRCHGHGCRSGAFPSERALLAHPRPGPAACTRPRRQHRPRPPRTPGTASPDGGQPARPQSLQTHPCESDLLAGYPWPLGFLTSTWSIPQPPAEIRSRPHDISLSPGSPGTAASAASR